ncbi:tRNA pseudouridine(54/55) synthase Pus10 [Candidatus Acetothermia bacterium]|nr:tRNA pseudouridine(54/55) synthase Pus10 [Candidatus Acetothermia bacterium]
MSVLLEKARRLVSEGSLCDHCLGRVFSQMGTGLRNEERGRALRVCLCMEDGARLQLAKECWVCRGAFQQVERWARRVVERVERLEFKTYLMGTRAPLKIEMIEKHLKEKYELAGEPFKQTFNREVGRRFGEIYAEQKHPIAVDFLDPEIALLMDLETDMLELHINPLFIYGRYKKFVRTIPQTKWPCRDCKGRGCERCHYTGKMYQESVEELISESALAVTQGTGTAFHGAGREDIDALMLGSGRPFVLEVKEPKVRTFDLEKLQNEVNSQASGKIEISELRMVKTEVVERVKNLEAEKIYEARVRFEQPITEQSLDTALQQLSGATIEQRTPQRVVHRRADLIRKRCVLAIEGKISSEQEAVITIRCEGGLYIKELVSGDEGRTQPNLSELLQTKAKVTELNVLEVIGNFIDS